MEPINWLNQENWPSSTKYIGLVDDITFKSKFMINDDFSGTFDLMFYLKNLHKKKVYLDEFCSGQYYMCAIWSLFHRINKNQDEFNKEEL